VVDDATWWVPADADGTTLAALASLVTAEPDGLTP
jgi:hypothetical protein